jgi:hypothetical protein
VSSPNLSSQSTSYASQDAIEANCRENREVLLNSILLYLRLTKPAFLCNQHLCSPALASSGADGAESGAMAAMKVQMTLTKPVTFVTGNPKKLEEVKMILGQAIPFQSLKLDCKFAGRYHSHILSCNHFVVSVLACFSGFRVLGFGTGLQDDHQERRAFHCSKH